MKQHYQHQQRSLGGQRDNNKSKKRHQLLLFVPQLNDISLGRLFLIGSVTYAIFNVVLMHHIPLPSTSKSLNNHDSAIQLLRNQEKRSNSNNNDNIEHQQQAADNKNKEGASDGIFVVSLQGTPNADAHNEGRLDSFKEAWRKSCGSDPEIILCPGVVDERRGYGITLSLRNCLQKARIMNLEVTMIFEDDARLFDNESSMDFCDARKRQSKVWADLPEDTFIAFLGGHSWKFTNQDQDQLLAASSHPSKFLQASRSYGAYGFAVPRQSLDTLLETIKGDIAHGFVDEGEVRHTEFLSPEKSWYRKARNVSKKMYAIHPLAVWHHGGFSNTWKRDRAAITGEEEDDDGDDENVGVIRGVEAR